MSVYLFFTAQTESIREDHLVEVTSLGVRSWLRAAVSANSTYCFRLPTKISSSI